MRSILFQLGEVTIANSVNNIGEQAFISVHRLTNAIIGNNVTNIADEAFYYCTGLKGVYFEGNAPGLGGGGCLVMTSSADDNLLFTGDHGLGLDVWWLSDRVMEPAGTDCRW